MNSIRTIKFLTALVIAALLIPAGVRLLALPSLHNTSHLTMGQRYASAGLGDEARVEFARAIEDDSTDVRAHDEYIFRVLMGDNASDKKTLWDQCHRRRDGSALDMYRYALVRSNFIGLPNQIESVRYFGKALEADPDMRMAHFRRGQILTYLPGDDVRELGMRDLETEIAQNPEYAGSYKALFGYYYRQDRLADARAVAYEGRKNSSDDSLLAEDLAQTHFADGNLFGAAREYFRGKFSGPWAGPVFILTLLLGAGWMWELCRRSRCSFGGREFAAAILLGALSVVIAQVGFNLLAKNIAPPGANFFWKMFETSFGEAFIEECAKFLVFIPLIIFAAARMRSVTEGMLYCVLVAVVFAAFENAFLARKVGAATAGGEFFVRNAMHLFGAGIAGFFLAREKLAPSERPFVALAGLLLAMLFHAAYTAAMFAGGIAIILAFLVVVVEMLLFLLLLAKSMAGNPYYGNAGNDERGGAEIPAGIIGATIIAFSVACSVMLACFGDFAVVVRAGFADLLRAVFVLIVFAVSMRRVWIVRRSTPGRLFIR